MRSSHVLGTVSAMMFGVVAGAATFELNPAGIFSYNGVSTAGTLGTITNVGERELDQPFLNRVQSAFDRGVNGQTTSLIPVASPLAVTITLDRLVAEGFDTPAYPGAGWSHAVRFNADDATAGLDGWRLIHIVGGVYAPDAQHGWANFATEDLRSDGYSPEFLAANQPFYSDQEDRNNSTSFGEYDIAQGSSPTYFTINGSFLDLEITYLLARVNGGNVEIGAAWGFHERIDVVPAPAAIAAIGLGLLAAARRRRG